MNASAPLVMQASAVAIDGRGLLIEGPPGSGKSSLALALIDRGAGLIGDDAVTVAPESGLLIAAPPPNIAGLLE
ncbi:MAG TPA: serine kinase, partial [Erythrobacter sp.]|nr:serine kinase [Erythrobacter sp.]